MTFNKCGIPFNPAGDTCQLMLGHVGQHDIMVPASSRMHSYKTCIHYGSFAFQFQRPTRIDAVIFVKGVPMGPILKVGNRIVDYPNTPVVEVGITVFVLPEYKTPEEETNQWPLYPAWYLEVTEVW